MKDYDNLFDFEIKGIHPISLLKYHFERAKWKKLNQSKNKSDEVIYNEEENLNDSPKQQNPILIPPVLMSNIKKEEEKNYHTDENGNIIEKRLEQLKSEQGNIVSMNSYLLDTQYKLEKELDNLLEEKNKIESKIKVYKKCPTGDSNNELNVLNESLKIINDTINNINKELELIKNRIKTNNSTLETINTEIESITSKLKIIIDEENEQKEVIEFYKKGKNRKLEIENIWRMQEERIKEISKKMKETYEILNKKQKEYEDLPNYYYGLYKTLWDEEFSKVDDVTLYFSREQQQKENLLKEEIKLLKTKMENLKDEISKILEEGRSYVPEIEELEFALEKAEKLFGKEFLDQNIDIKKRKM